MATEKTSLRLSLTDQSGDTRQKNITDINPDATNNELSEFVDEISKITTDIIGEVKKVTTTTDTVKDNLQNPEMYWVDGASSGQKPKTKSVTLTTIMQDTTHDTQGSEADKCGAHTEEIGYALDSKQIPYIKSNGTMIPVSIGANVSPSETRPNWVLYLSAGWNFDYKLEGDTFVPSLYGDIVIAIDANDTYDSDEITLTITEG